MTDRRKIEWDLNTGYCHHGIPLSNGVLGALIWFQPDRILLTINRADYWDRRGATQLTEACNYETIKGLLLEGKFEEIRDFFKPYEVGGYPVTPARLPMGRFEFVLNQGVSISSAWLDLVQGEAVIELSNKQKEKSTVRFAIAMERDAVAVQDEPASGLFAEVIAKPADSFPRVQEYYYTRGFEPSTAIDEEETQGWVQPLPADPAAAVACSRTQNGFAITAVYGPTADEAVASALQELADCRQAAYCQLTEQAKTRWNELWERSPKVGLPGTDLEQLYDMGIYRMLGNCMPGKLGPTLQGPWGEEHRMIPWGGDYHFNINVQLMLMPAYAANHTDSVTNLFRMLDEWKPLLAERAAKFVGIDDGYMLSHATDDRGQSIGGMWTGVIDHANTSWVAQMMWQYYRYTLDEEFLLQEAYPFMKRALNVFIQMLEPDGERYKLPVSVSPEYGGDGANALGANSTFFLVNFHFLCEKIIRVYEQFGVDPEYAAATRKWKQLVPEYTTGAWGGLEYEPRNPVCNEELYLWEGQPLAVSHRHHSHLAGIFPFDMMDLETENEREIVRNSYRTWVDKGMGRWAGWSFPWASILNTRLGKKEMALHCLQLLRSSFTMRGYATRHNSLYEGLTYFHSGDIMQLDAGIAASAAVLEMLVHSRRETLHVFPGLPDSVADAVFYGVRAEGAFLVSGRKSDGQIDYIRIQSEKGARLRLANPFPNEAAILEAEDGTCSEHYGPLIELPTTIGQTITLLPGRPKEAGAVI
ncbi:glycosyl hydrolase family 95 catalytic domain-containing protein [Paenibacillus silvisoli]|uniref:glycosyl hydrolase family 95 catalytic domain-containing protein n=1 Tax=Paenibacillus silvisoli TaxID=3110539 RepID=UPI002804F519|nr:hypothetical protein [Paenibacillus silvisoli]